MSDPLIQLIATTLEVPVAKITDDLAYEEIPEWDSMNHVNLMLAIEEKYDKEIDEELMISLLSVGEIRAFVSE